MNKRSISTSVAALTAGIALALAAPLAAFAHIGIDPGQVEAGSDAVISFRVPNESATTSTTTVKVTFPQDTPFGFVDYVPVAGWTVAVTSDTLATPIVTDDGEVTEAVTSITWTAIPGNEIVEGQVQVFPLSVGPVPDTGSIVLPVEQTYSDGTVVAWTETGENAEFPAPVLYVNDAPVDHHHGAAAGGTVTVGEHADHSGHAAGAEATSVSGSDDVLARVLGIGGLVLGAIAVVLALTSRRKPGETATVETETTTGTTE